MSYTMSAVTAQVAPPAEVLVTGAELVATLDADRREIAGGWVAIAGGAVTAVGPPGHEPPAATTVDARGCLVTPGLVNTHHHMWQNLTRSYRPMTDQAFHGWLGALYPLWERIDTEAIASSTWVAMAELVISGCTTTSDHLYLQPAGCGSLFDSQVETAMAFGMRFTACRGAVDRSRRHGALPPDSIAQDTDTILADCARVVARYHDPSPLSRLRVALAPHSLHAASNELMVGTAALAERLDVRLHTHLAADVADDEAALLAYGCRPVEWFESVGWASPRTWVAHCVFPSAAEIARLGAAGVGVAHCATAMLLMGVGVAPVPSLRASGAPVGLGVDGSSNSDAASLWLEARTALLAGRSRFGPTALSARDVLEMATLGGAACLGRQGEVGVLTAGAAGDVAVWALDDLAHAGAVSDPIEAWLRCGPSAPRHVLIGGTPFVRHGELQVPDLAARLRHHRALATAVQAP